MESGAPASKNGRIGSFVATGLFMLVGPIVWAAHFLVVYGAHAVVCSQHVAGNLGTREIVGGATLVALAVLAFVSRRGSPGMSRDEREEIPHFLRTTMLLLTGLSALAIVYAGATVLFLPECLVLR